MILRKPFGVRPLPNSYWVTPGKLLGGEYPGGDTEEDTERRLREEVARLEAMRNQLANDVENMARHLEAERNRLRTTLSEVLKWVDDNVQPAAALMALRPRGADGRPTSAQPAAQPSNAQPPAAQPQARTEHTNGAGAGERDNDATVLDLRGGAPESGSGHPS